MQRDDCVLGGGEDPFRASRFPRCSENHGRENENQSGWLFIPKAFVEAIAGRKTFGVGDVNRDGHPNEPQASHIESKRGSSILTSRPLLTFHAVQPERLQHFQPACASFVSALDFIA